MPDRDLRPRKSVSELLPWWWWDGPEGRWRRVLAIRGTCHVCDRRFWRWRRYVCRRCM